MNTRKSGWIGLVLVACGYPLATWAQSPPLLINNEEVNSDEAFVACISNCSPGRIANLLKLHSAQARLQETFTRFHEEIKKSPNMESSSFQKELRSLWDHAHSEITKVRSQLSGAKHVRQLAQAEADRMLSETALRLAMASLGSRDPNSGTKLRNDFLTKADAWAQKAFSTVSSVPANFRNELAPRLMARIAMTELSSLQIKNMEAEVANGAAYDNNQKLLKKYYRLRSRDQESQWLRIVDLEATHTLADTRIGSGAGTIYISPTKQLEILTKTAEVSNQLELQDPKLLRRSRIVALKTPFYIGGRIARSEALQNLESQINNADESFHEPAHIALREIIEHHAGTSFGHELLKFGLRVSKSGEGREYFLALEKQEQERAKTYDDSLKEALGEESYKRLGFASFKHLIQSQGSLGKAQEDYVEKLMEFGKVFEAQQKNPKSSKPEEMEQILSGLDLAWARIQCHKHMMDSSPRTKNSKSQVQESPFKTMKVDLNSCRLAPGETYSPLLADRASANFINTAIKRKLRSELTWIAGEAAFDVGTILISGGAVMLAKTAVKSSIKKGATHLLRKQILNPRMVKTVARSGTFVADGLALDLTNQSIQATRHLIQEGLKGDWNTEHFTKNFAYTSGDISAMQHVGRVVASGLAAKGLEALWGKIPQRGSFGKFAESRLGEFSLGVAKSTINSMAKSQVLSPVVDATLGIKEPEFKEIAETMMSGEAWFKSFESSLRGKTGSSIAGKNSAGSGRHLSRTLLSTIVQLKLTPEEIANLQELESCLENLAKSGVMPASKTVTRDEATTSGAVDSTLPSSPAQALPHAKPPK